MPPPFFREEAMKLLLVSEVADRLNCSESLVYELLKQGRLPHINIGLGRQGGKRICEEDLEKFLEENRVNGGSVTEPVGLKHIKLR